MANEAELHAALERLITVETRHLRVRTWWYGLIYGTALGIGSTIGVLIVLTIAASLLEQASVLPVIGDWIDKIVPLVKQALNQP